KHRTAGHMKPVATTTYWASDTRARNLVLYHDKPSRKLQRGSPCVHLELRLATADALRRHGLRTASDVLNADIQKIFAKNVLIALFDAKSFQERSVKKTVQAERKSFLNRRRFESSDFVDRYRARIPVRARALLLRIGLDTAQRFADYHPGV